jgi:photosystem II stability/assembly factor-like uncharacterized protein
MSDIREEQPFDAYRFLERLRREPRTRGERDPERPTPREIKAFTTAPLAGRLWWLTRRRASSDGIVRAGARANALRDKLERFRPPSVPLAGGATVAPCRWLPIGPRNINGRIKCLAIHPVDPRIIYAGSADGGVWKTTDAGQSWRPKMDDLPSMSIGALAIDPQAPDTVYAGTGEALKVADPSEYLWAYEGAGVFRTTDGGDTWSAFGAVQNQFIYRLAVDPNDSTNVLCAGYARSGGGLCRWDQATTSWIVERSGIFTDVLFDPVNAGVVYAGRYQTSGPPHAAVLKSTNSGRAWVSSSTGLPNDDVGRVSLTLARAKPEVLYAKIEDSYWGTLLGVYRTGTAAAGSAATPAWTPCTDPDVDAPDPRATPQLWWCSYIAADPSDANGNTVYAGGIDLARSADGGQSWERLSRTYQAGLPAAVPATRPTHADQHDLVFDPTNSARLFIANDGGVFTGTYTGGSPPVDWRKVSTGLAVTQFYDLATSRATPSMLGGGCQDNGTVVSTGGLSWRQVHGGDGSYLAFHSTLPWTLWVQRWDFLRSVLRRSLDSGTTVNGFPDADNGIQGGAEMPVTLLAMDPATPAVLFAGTDRVYRTSNGDAPMAGNVVWSAVSPPTNGVVTEISVAASNLVYAGTMNGRLYRATTFTGPASFVDVTPTVAGWPTRWLSSVTVVPGPQEVVYVTFHGDSQSAAADQVWKGVFNPGTGQFSSMVNISGTLPNVPAAALVLDPAAPTILYVATDIGVFRHDGTKWDAFDEGLPRVMVVDLALDPARGLLRAATHGRGMYQRRLAASCSTVDIYLRDNTLDTGEVIPSPSGEWDPERPGELVHHWQSADIKVDAPPFAPVDAFLDGVEFDDPAHRSSPVLGYPVEDIPGIVHDNPIRGVANRVYVQVHNRGWATAASVTMKLLWADAGLGLPPLPANFWAGFANDSYTQADWHLIGNVVVTNLEAGFPRVVSVQWTPPATASAHACLLAMVDSPQDPLLPQTELNVDTLTRNNKHVTQRNVHTVSAILTAGARAGWAVPSFRNAFMETRQFTLRLDVARSTAWRGRLVLPRDPDGVSLSAANEGFEISRPSPTDWRAQVDAALATGAIDRVAADSVATFPHPLVLTLPRDRRSAAVHGISLERGARVPIALILDAPASGPAPAPMRVDLVQLCEGQPTGGCTFDVRALEPGAWPP